MFDSKGYRLPAEWEPQSGIMLTWPHAATDWAPMLSEVTETYRQMAREISRREPLLVVAPPPPATLQAAVLPQPPAEQPPGGGTSNLVCVTCPTNDTWARDHGFICLVSTSHPHDSLLLDFCFNGWGEKFPAELDNAINRHLYDAGVLKGEYVSQLDFVLEGGSIESDGHGTIFTTTGCLMAPHRNQPLSHQQIEERLRQVLAAERVVWIDHGQLTGDDTDGHIDTLVRICPDDTLLYMSCNDPNDEHYHELQLMEQQLRALRTLDGRPYRLLPLPLPRPIYSPQDHERLPATYANFLIVNGAVLCPTYDQPDLDAEALATIGKAFPGRDIVGIDCRSLIKQHGSLHCCTMQLPEGVLLAQEQFPNEQHIWDSF